MAPEILEGSATRCYVGEVDRAQVVTGLGLVVGNHVGIFNVATPPDRRGNGYGSAITARAIEDGFAAGGTWAWLQSSPSGLSVYERLGFDLVERWDLWIGAA